ncbi:MAG: hypothetical protein HYU36_06080 [Planctomycetes bacterium]|nr:hypothetical protein [Planctomycetota bacterium]
MNKILIYFQIIHSSVDIGTLAPSVRQLRLEKLGRRGLERYLCQINQLWETIERSIDVLNLPREGLRVYQDGLPICGQEEKIIAELADAGSKNHQLLMRLKERGARITGTESSELLEEEYSLMKKMLEVSGPGSMAEKARLLERSDSLLRRRDRFIANRINDTLGPSETGILFLGIAHGVVGNLNTDIQVVYPLGKPVMRRIQDEKRHTTPSPHR